MTDAEPLYDWLVHVAEVLDVDRALVEDATAPVLGMVRDVAHGVVRPAGPMTAFLVGVVAGRTGAGTAEATARVREALAQVERELRVRGAAGG
ncbi:molybdopterin-guanine dinucleotide biosynthesis protein MobA [Cellulomonas sp. JZ18]|uniref:DUF6457 domain-containing protein n=1 Tax=Cellulomonas sp. JZ18 TaxID=2654191 RepID=UPI0012D3B3F0|nr:DUF6457 domain-containing protein [Cellulomonas sp. JZ18]QGQ19477.1 molybdopterin-guanine dinucleotide biosynthesis protein MobA [Cellulomonas sp. JZ18]